MTNEDRRHIEESLGATIKLLSEHMAKTHALEFLVTNHIQDFVRMSVEDRKVKVQEVTAIFRDRMMGAIEDKQPWVAAWLDRKPGEDGAPPAGEDSPAPQR